MIRRPPRSTLIVYTTLFRFHQISLESKLNGRQKVKGGNGSNIASSSASSNASSSASSSASSIPLNLGVGCAPSCWPIFGFRNLLGAPRGRRGQFSVQSDNRFSGGGGGVGSLPRAWRRVGVPGAAGAKKICEIGVGFFFAAHSEPFESPGARAAERDVDRELRGGG